MTNTELAQLVTEQTAEYGRDREQHEARQTTRAARKRENLIDLTEARDRLQDDRFYSSPWRLDHAHGHEDPEDRHRGRYRPPQSVSGLYQDGHAVSTVDGAKQPLLCEVCRGPIVYDSDVSCEFGIGKAWDDAQRSATGLVRDAPLRHRGDGYAVRRVVEGRYAWFPVCPCNGCGDRRGKSKGRPRKHCGSESCKREFKTRQKRRERKCRQK